MTTLESTDTVIVTGGAGFIGSAVCRLLLESTPCKVINLDLLTYAGDPRNLGIWQENPRYLLVQGDICDRDLVAKLLREERCTGILHLAAESHVDRSIDGSAAFIRTNIEGTHALLEATRAYRDELPVDKAERFRFLHVSTDEVFGDLGPDDAPFTPESRYHPSSPYSASKAASDHLVTAWGRTYGLPYVLTNCSNNYGPYQFPEKLIPLVIVSCLMERDFPLYGDGKNIRDWLYVDDHAQGLIQAFTDGKLGEAYAFGGDAEQENYDVVHTICKTLDHIRPRANGKTHAELVQYVSDRPGHDRRYAVDSSAARQQLDWRPTHTFEKGLEATIRWYLANSEWWSVHWPKS